MAGLSPLCVSQGGPANKLRRLRPHLGGLLRMTVCVVPAPGRRHLDALRILLRLTCIAEADGELLDWDDCQQFVNIPPCPASKNGQPWLPPTTPTPIPPKHTSQQQQLTLASSPRSGARGVHGLPGLAWHQSPSSHAPSTLPPALPPAPSAPSSHPSSLSREDAKSPGGAESLISLPVLSYKSSVFTSPCDADTPSSSERKIINTNYERHGNG